jgi:hypothetical protein
MRLNPAFQKTCGHGKLHGLALAAFKLHAGEPAQVDVLPDLRAQPFPNARPSLLIHDGHGGALAHEMVEMNAKIKDTTETEAKRK